MKTRPLIAEGIGTAVLVIFGAGAATLMFGFGIAGTDTPAAVVATALAFGLVLGALVYSIGPISGCHVNPAVTLGFLVSRRISLQDAVGYWVAQLIGGIAGGAALFGFVRLSSDYHTGMPIGADGFGRSSMIGIDAAGAFITEVVLTFLFVLVILAVTRRATNAAVAGLVIGLALVLVHLVGIPIDGTSVNPARSLGPAIFEGGRAVRQLWVFILAPLVGGAGAAFAYGFFYPAGEEEATIEPAPQEQVAKVEPAD